MVLLYSEMEEWVGTEQKSFLISNVFAPFIFMACYFWSNSVQSCHATCSVGILFEIRVIQFTTLSYVFKLNFPENSIQWKSTEGFIFVLLVLSWQGGISGRRWFTFINLQQKNIQIFLDDRIQSGFGVVSLTEVNLLV